MNLYHWHSDYLAYRFAGDIFVIASSVGEARRKAREEFSPLKEDHPSESNHLSLLKVMKAPHFVEEFQKAVALFEKDISEEPTLLPSGVGFVTGSA